MLEARCRLVADQILIRRLPLPAHDACASAGARSARLELRIRDDLARLDPPREVVGDRAAIDTELFGVVGLGVPAELPLGALRAEGHGLEVSVVAGAEVGTLMVGVLVGFTAELGADERHRRGRIGHVAPSVREGAATGASPRSSRSPLGALGYHSPSRPRPVDPGVSGARRGGS